MSIPAVRIFLLLAATLCLAFGCGPSEPEEQLKTKRVTTKRDPKVIAPNPNALVDMILKKHAMGDAEEILQLADMLKAQGEFDEAEAHYLAALQKKPRLTFANYQLACNYALWGRKALALETLKKTVDAGFWGYEVMKDDDDLQNIRSAPEFAGLLETVKQRYAVEAPKQAGGSMLELPRGDAPESGWPVIVFLHGFGDGKESYRSLAQSAAEHGFAGIPVSGPIVHYEKRFAWPTDSFETTHKHLSNELRKYSDKPLDRSRVFLLGFSQGAEHAAALTAQYPESYAGAIALSPGGLPDPKQATRGKGPARPLYVTIGKSEPIGNKSLARHWADDWRKAGWPVREESHNGGHQFPPDWDEEFPNVLVWLRDGK